MNPYEDLDAIEEEQQLEDGLDEDYGEEDDYDEDGLLPFENQDELLDENFRDGNVYNYSGNKKQQPVQGKKANLDNASSIMPSDGKQPIVRRESEIVSGPLDSQFGRNKPSFKPGEPF